MVINAKFDSKCTRCYGRVFEGDRVIWVSGTQGVYHVNCEGETHRPRMAVAMDDTRRAKETAIAESEPIIPTHPLEPIAEPVKAEPAKLNDPRDPRELCAFLTSLSREQLRALAEIVSHELASRETETDRKAA